MAEATRAEPFQGLRRRDRLRGARRQPAADQRRGDTEGAVDQGADRIDAQRRGDAAEVAAAEVAAEHPQGKRGERRAEGQAEHAAGEAEQRRLAEHQREPAACRQAEHAEQGELLLPLGDREREDGEHQEGAGEHRHQRQHGEVDAIGAGDVGEPLLRLARRGGAHARGQDEIADHPLALGAGRQAQVDARQPADHAERDLGAGDVHHRQRRPGGGDAAGDAQAAPPSRRLQRDPTLALRALEPARAFGVEEQRLRLEHGEAIGGVGRPRQERRRERGDHQRIDADDPDRHALAGGVEGVGLGLDHRAGERHLRMGGDSRVQRLVEARRRADDLEVGLAVDRAHRGAEFGQRRGVDQVHRERQRHAEHHGQERGAVAPGMVAKLRPGELAQQRRERGRGARDLGAHRLLSGRCLAASA